MDALGNISEAAHNATRAHDAVLSQKALQLA